MQIPGDKLNRIHNINCLDGVRALPDECVDIVVTSPPYWGQRGDDGIGLEEDPREYIRNLTGIFLEVKRVLKSNGLMWLNIADSYNTPINWRFEDHKYSTLGPDGNGLDPNNSAYTKNRGRRKAFVKRDTKWLQYGNLLAIPYRLILSLCDHGMLFRGEVIWAKRKAMPEGRCRRPHRKHESIYILAKNENHSFRTYPPVSSVWDLPAETNKTSHTSTFPIELPVSCIEASGIGQGVVLDPFMGSGTTAIASLKLGHSYIGYELNAQIKEEAEERIKKYMASVSNAQLELAL
jgi:DNA modification methylase